MGYKALLRSIRLYTEAIPFRIQSYLLVSVFHGWKVGRSQKGVTTVVIKIPTFGDKHYVELFYRLVDDNLPRKAAGGNEKTKVKKVLGK